jgi:hypothetical protein
MVRECLDATLSSARMPDLTHSLCSTGYKNAIPWWDQSDETSGLACNMSYAILDDALTVRVLSRRNGSLAGVTIRSRKNPMDGLISSVWGLLLFGVYPVLLFIGLALYSLRILRQARARDAPMGLVVRLIIMSNLAICIMLVVLLCAGGGAHGLLLPDLRRRWKCFNYVALAGSSAAVDVLLALAIGDIIQQRPPHSPPSRTGLASFAAIVALDFAHGVGASISVDVWTRLVLPALLALAELTSSAFLARRCFVLAQSVHDAASDTGSSMAARIQAFHRRLVAAGVSAVRRDLVYIVHPASTLTALARSAVPFSGWMCRLRHLVHPLCGRQYFHHSDRRGSRHCLLLHFQSLHCAWSAPVCGP